jgi:hypothetical protein
VGNGWWWIMALSDVRRQEKTSVSRHFRVYVLVSVDFLSVFSTSYTPTWTKIFSFS